MLSRRHADIQNAIDAGCDACLVKPVRQTVLYECLVNVMAGRTQETVAIPAAAERTSTAAPGSRGNILLVEDNLINQQVALGILQIQGYAVTVVNNGREALDAHAQGAFDAVLMDCHMPEMDGFEATKQIRVREAASGARRLPIIALTANAMAHDREQCLNAGMDDHLSKPFGMQSMQDMLDRWVPQARGAQSQAAELAALATAKAAEVLDREVLDQLGKVLTNGKPEVLVRVIQLYLTESPKLMQKLKEAGLARDALHMARIAHSLKSGSANVGAKVLGRYCDQIEMCARRGDLDEACNILAKTETEHAGVHAALTAEFELRAASNA
jgi:CheY-like chemotaxis protein